MSEWMERAKARTLPPVSRDTMREPIIDSPREWTVGDLQAWTRREADVQDRTDDPADAAAKAVRSAVAR